MSFKFYFTYLLWIIFKKGLGPFFGLVISNNVVTGFLINECRRAY